MKDSLGDRMKRYEDCYRIKLPRRLPVIVRVDGRAFHTLTRGFKKPFDGAMDSAMNEVAMELCREISGCKMAFVESDEISLLITNNDTLETSPWFDNNLQKIVSITASVATRVFNREFRIWFDDLMPNADYDNYLPALDAASFDSRAFVLPEEEVVNYFLWRQMDAVRCSINSYARSMFSHKELQGKSCKEMQEMMFQKHGFNWNDVPVFRKRGRCIIKDENGWKVDFDIPSFNQDRSYIERLIPFFAKEEETHDDQTA